MKRLLAKSFQKDKFPSPPDYALLLQHSRDVAQAGRTLARTVGAPLLAACGLPQELLPALETTLILCGWLQDLGKANSHFQTMVSSAPEVIQLLRHETVSGILAKLVPEFQDWLAPLGNETVHVAVWGAVGHHRKFDEETSPKQAPQAMTVLLSHPDFNSILQEMAQDLGLGQPPSFQKDLVISRSLKEKGDLGALEVCQELTTLFEDEEGVCLCSPASVCCTRKSPGYSC